MLDSKLYIQDLTKAASAFDFSDLRNKSVLITGGLGLICSAIADLLITINCKEQLNIHIYLAARNRILFYEKYSGYPNIDFVPYDALEPILFNFPVDYVIVGAGVASPDKYTSEPVETMLSNIVGVKNILEYARNNEVMRVLYISSSEIYGKKLTDEQYSEVTYGMIDLDSIRSSYAIAKRASELLCKAYLAEYKVDTVIVRPGHIFGPTASKTDRRISSDFAYKAAKSIPLEMKSSGMQRRSYCYSIDAAVAILMVLIKGHKGEAYNICTEEVLTIKEMAEILSKAGRVTLSYKEPTKEELQTFNPMNNSSLSFAKLNELGFHGCFSIKEALEHTVEILREQQVVFREDLTRVKLRQRNGE